MVALPAAVLDRGERRCVVLTWPLFPLEIYILPSISFDDKMAHYTKHQIIRYESRN